jgi:GNAT superfamily N-acetyltransferase
MDVAERRALMDLNMQEMYREDVRVMRGGFVVERSGILMTGSPAGTHFTNMVMPVATVDAATVHAEAMAVFGAAGLPWSVWTRAHADEALEAELTARGFLELVTVPAMVLDPADARPAPLPDGAALRPVVSTADVEAYARVMSDAWSVYGVDGAATAAHFVSPASLIAPTRWAVLAWQDGEAVAGAILYVSHDVGGVGWVGTVPAVHGRGYGAAVTAAVVEEGIRRGVRFLSLQASPLGAPVYRRMGFSTPSCYRVFLARD